MGHNHLYINGCSFTKGHELTEEESWPFLLQKELDLSQKYKNKSQNANSLGTIVKKSMIDLRNTPKNTLVVIGLTWFTRYSLLVNDFFVNLGPGDYLNKKNFNLSRFVPLFNDYLDGENGDLIEIRKNKNNLIQKYCDFLFELCKHDENFITNQFYEHNLLVKNLENYLTSNNIDYIFIEMNNSLELKKGKYNYLRLFDYDTEKILNLNIDEGKMISSHPSKEQCIEIKDQIIQKIKKLYPKYLKSNQLNLF
jgi:hypothetical protein